MPTPLAARLRPHATSLALPALAAGFALALACFGLPDREPVILGPATVLYYWLSAGLVALAWLAAAFGLGWPLVACLCGAGFQPAGAGRPWLQMPLGVAALLFLDHALGVFGLLSGPSGRYVAIGLCAVGIALLGAQAVRYFKSAPILPSAPWTALLGVVGLSIMLVAACNPPGVLWSSEAGGFDALSYHLPLAQEWAAQGSRIRPLHHNVYSFLPSYMESAYTHIAALNHSSLVAGEGLGALSCQLLHVMLAGLAAALTARAAFLFARRAGADERPARLGAGLAGAIVLATPWVVVCGSLAYNEMAACALFAGALIATLTPDLTLARRALITGLLMGAACACKPTFLFLAGPTTGLLLLASSSSPPRPLASRLLPLLACGAIGGLITFAPPLIRNYLASGNPVFPAATSIFGPGPWTQEQADRFHKAHGPEKRFASQLALLVSPASTSTVDAEPRGFLHQQWGGAGILPLAGFGAMVLLILRPATRQEALCLFTGSLGACAWWAAFSHAQSRFLIPILIPMAIALGTLAARCFIRAHPDEAELSPRRTAAVGLLTLIPLWCSAHALTLFITQARHHPNAMLTAGVPYITGESIRPEINTLDLAELELIESNHSPEFYVNLHATPPHKVYLLGDAATLYFTVPIIYHTTWDLSPLGVAMAAHPDTPSRWTAALRDLGCRYVLINLDELNRYMTTYGYDPRVTPERIAAWLKTLGEPLKEWVITPTGPRRIFYRLPATQGPSI